MSRFLSRAYALALVAPLSALAQTPSTSEIQALRQEMTAMRQAYEARLQMLEQRLATAEQAPVTTTAAATPPAARPT